MGFYDSYLAMLQTDGDNEELPELAESGFRKKLLESQKQDYNLVKLFSSGVKHTLAKPQRVLHDEDDYYIGIDMYTNTFYVCYKHLLMVDVDFYKSEDEEVTETDIINRFEKYCLENPELRFKLYRSRNGIHGFLVSHKMEYQDIDSISMMLELGSDFYYTVYTYLRGWSVRLNKKKTDLSDQLYSYIQDVGEGEIDERLEKLVDLHINLVDVFKDTEPNSMYGN